MARGRPNVAVDGRAQALHEGAGRARLERGHRRAVRQEQGGQGGVVHAAIGAQTATLGIAVHCTPRTQAVHGSGNVTRMRPATSPTRRPSIWLLAWRQTQRDFRAGELRLLLAAVMLAVAALTAVGFFADRIERGLARDARQMLGGDAIVSQRQARAAGLRRRGAPLAPCRWPPPPASRAWAARPRPRAAPRAWWRSRRSARPIRCAAA